MKVSEIYSGNHLNAETLEGTPTYSIASVESVEFDDKEKLVLEFDECEQTLPLNKTNAMALVELYGDDTDDWTGKRVTLHRERVNYQGKLVNAIRLSKPKAKAGKAGKAGKAKGDDIPF